MKEQPHIPTELLDAVRRLEETKADPARDPGQSWQRIEALLDREKRRPKVWIWMAAAAALLLLGIGLSLVLRQPEPKPLLAVASSNRGDTTLEKPDPSPKEIKTALPATEQQTNSILMPDMPGTYSIVVPDFTVELKKDQLEAAEGNISNYDYGKGKKEEGFISLNGTRFDGALGGGKIRFNLGLINKNIEANTYSWYFGNGQEDPYATEEYSSIVENVYQSTLKSPQTTFSIDVDKAAYSNMRRFLNNGQLPPANAVRIEELVNYFSYDYKAPKKGQPFNVITEVADCPWNTGHKLLQVALQGREIPKDDLPPANLVFLLDVSSSMSDANKLPLLKQAFGLLVEELRPQDKVAIVVYAGAAGVVLPPTAGNEKARLLAALNQLEAGGSTAGGAGIELAYSLARQHFTEEGNNRVILATDGDFNVGVSGEQELIQLIESKRDQGIFLTVLGLGTGNYKDSKMEQLADKGNGNFAYIDNFKEAKKTLVNEFGGTLFTIAKDVKLQLEFNPALVKGYRLIGYENRVLRNEDFANDKVDAGELGSGHTVTALYELIPFGSKEQVDSVSDFKYLQYKLKGGFSAKEWVTVKLRYKSPQGTKSRLLTHVHQQPSSPFSKASENLRFAASVAEFGLLLRNSSFKGDANFAEVHRNAAGALGKDKEGYRTEFLQLVKTAEALQKRQEATIPVRD